MPEGKAKAPWFKVLELLTVRQRVAPGSKGHLRRRWFLSSAMDQLLEEDFAVALRKEGFPLACEIMPGNTSDKTTRRWFLQKIQAQSGQARRLWIMDRGLPTEETLAEMRRSQPPVGDVAAPLWERCLQLTEIEAAFQTLKSDLQLRPIRHQVELRIEAHILVCFLACCLSVTLRKGLQAHAPGLTSRAVWETLSGILMLDIHVPLADGRELVMPRYTQPEAEHGLVLEKLGWELPPQSPPRIRRAQIPSDPKDLDTKS